MPKKQAIDEARALFAASGLPFPPIPAPFRLYLKTLGPWRFATRSDIPSAYNIDWFINEVKEDRAPIYVVVSHAGHGINSYAIHYYCVNDNLAMFLQLPWGGVYMDDEKCKRDMKDAFELSARVYDRVHELVDTGEIPGSKRLVVVETRLYTPRWAWQSRQAPKGEPLAWNECESALTAVLESM